MALMIEKNTKFTDKEGQLKELAMAEFGWTEETYNKYYDEIHEMIKGYSPAELKKFEREQKRENQQLKAQLFAVNLIEKTALPRRVKQELVKIVARFTEVIIIKKLRL